MSVAADGVHADQAPEVTEPDGQGRIGVLLFVTLGMLSAIGPFAIDMYLPAFPQIANELNASVTGVQLSLTTFLIGAGVGQLIFGPLSDRIGRRGPLIAGVVIFVIASIAAALAPTIEVLIGVRLLQGITGSAGMVIGRAMIADRVRGQQAAQAFSLMMLVSGIAPVVAPLLGSALAEPLGWRGLLWILFGIGVVALAAVLLFAPETRRPADRTPAGAGPGIRALATRAYLAPTLAFAFSFATLMAYISASPFLYQKHMGLSVVEYGLVFGFNACVLTVMSYLAVRLVRRFSSRSLARFGMICNLAGSLVFCAIALSGLPPLWLAVPLVVVIGSLGLTFGTCTALALGAVPGASGAASALLGFLQFAVAGLAAPLVGLGGELDPLPLALTLVVASLAATIAMLAVPRSGAAA